MIQLSLIIPSFNTKNLLENCLKSVFAQTKKVQFEVIVVDNHSTDGTVMMLKQKFPQVKVVVLQENVGYGQASNFGEKEAGGEWLLFLNSDTEIKKRAIDKVFDEIKTTKFPVTDPIVGCRLTYPDGSFQQSCGFFPTLIRVFAWATFLDDLPLLSSFLKPYQISQPSFYKKTQEVDWVTGAFLLIKRSVFAKVGGFDERIFMYSEEVDLCYRLKQAGMRIFYTPKVEVIHLKGASSKKSYEVAVVGEYQGLVNFFKKHKPSWQMIILKLTLALGALLRIVLFGMIEPGKRQAYEKALKKIC